MSRELIASLLFVIGLFVIAVGLGAMLGVYVGVTAAGVALCVVGWFLAPGETQ